MRYKNAAVIIISFIAAISVSGCALIDNNIVLLDAKTAASVNEDLLPVDVSGVFPLGTRSVSCWIKWKNARINTQVLSKWHYITDDIPILDHVFIIPKKEGAGSVTLTMPEGKSLPAGSYKIDLTCNNRLLRSVKFKVE